jgi:hypothetical protein
VASLLAALALLDAADRARRQRFPVEASAAHEAGGAPAQQGLPHTRNFPMTRKQDKVAAVSSELAKIARDTLKIATLDTRLSDSLDFHEVSVWSVRDALAQAFAAGLRSAEATGIELGKFEIGTADQRQHIQILQNTSNLFTVRNWEQIDGEHSPSNNAQFVNALLAFKHAISLAKDEIEDLVETVEG